MNSSDRVVVEAICQAKEEQHFDVGGTTALVVEVIVPR